MAIEWEDIVPEALTPGDKFMIIQGSGAGATPRLVTAGSAATRNVGTGDGNIPVLDATGKIPAARLPASGLATLMQPADDFADSYVLAQGRIGYETDTHKFKVGDGSTVWSTLSYAGGSGVGGVSSWDDLEDIPDPLSAIGALTAAADRYVYYTSSSAAALGTITSNARSLLAAADYAAMKALLDLEIGTDVQAYNANLGALSGLTLIADRLPYANGSGTLALTTFSAFARTLLDDADASAARTTLGFSAAIDAEWGDPVDELAGWDDAGDKTTFPLAVAAEATVYHVITGALAGMSDQGAALDHWLHGAMDLTPDSGDIEWLWPLDPATSLEEPEVALEEANRPSNAEVSLTSATSDANVVRLAIPEPDDADVLAGIERRSIGWRLVNDDPYETMTVELFAPALGYMTTQWRSPLDDFDLLPGEEAHVWGRVRGGEFDMDQIIRAAMWSTIAPVAGSGGTTTANNRTVANVLTGDLILAAALRADGQAITTPAGKGWVEASGSGFTTGRLLNTNRAVKLVWTFATADGSFNTGNFTNAGRVWAVAMRGVASVGRHEGASATNTSLAYPSLSSPLAPEAHVVGFTSRVLTTHAKPDGASVIDTNTYNDSAGATSGAWWTLGEQTSHAPSALTQTSAAWESAAFELIPVRLS